MTTLRTAAQQALEALEYHVEQTRPIWKTSEAIAALEAALAEPVQQGCDHCNHPMYAAIKCRVCGRVTEPVQEPVAGVVLNEEGRAALVEHGREEWHCVVRNARRLYTAPPQRKPLTEEEIRNAISTFKAAENLCGVNHIHVARAIERAHGIGA